ncbi:phage shock protein operon transcriptional activator [Radicibacter daui]|uniref:phage shock protein operon transcriptional activator n=1 Tax=Radicibacter daui TaxID=3064829 RepID=UPI004046AE79
MTNLDFATSPEPPQLLGTDPAFLQMLEQVSRLAPLERPALVIGERGTGKELIAARLHFLSRRWDMPFIKLNCAALPENLLESELFGHEAGAFTGARSRHKGRFERAHGGTLFLDEIATASQRVQEQILRVVEYGEMERLGGEAPLHVDVRIIAATNVDLPALAAEGKFRADLLDRLSFDVVTVPPLRARPADILLLAEAFGLSMAKTLGHDLFAGFSAAAEQALLNHPWPGNVRELRNVVERALYLTGPQDEPLEMLRFDPFDSPWRPGTALQAVPRPDETSLRLPEQGFAGAVADFERGLLDRAMEQSGGSQQRAAEALKLGYHQLRRLLGKYRS